MEFDSNLFKENIDISYEGITVYDIQYLKSSKVSVSFGIIKEIKKSFDIIHLCSTDSVSSGSPILDLKSNKVIGRHKSTKIKFNYNIGIFLKNPINEYITKNIKKIWMDDRAYFRNNYYIYFGCWKEILKCLCYINTFVDYFKYKRR